MVAVGVTGFGAVDFEVDMPHPLRDKAATNAADAMSNLS
jgi:hypothetical protein